MPIDPYLDVNLSADANQHTEQMTEVLITEDEQADSCYHIETDMGEYWSASRSVALAFAKKHETAEVWDTATSERIYWAEA